MCGGMEAVAFMPQLMRHICYCLDEISANFVIPLRVIHFCLYWHKKCKSPPRNAGPWNVLKACGVLRF